MKTAAGRVLSAAVLCLDNMQANRCCLCDLVNIKFVGELSGRTLFAPTGEGRYFVELRIILRRCFRFLIF